MTPSPFLSPKGRLPVVVAAPPSPRLPPLEGGAFSPASASCCASWLARGSGDSASPSSSSSSSRAAAAAARGECSCARSSGGDEADLGEGSEAALAWPGLVRERVRSLVW